MRLNNKRVRLYLQANYPAVRGFLKRPKPDPCSLVTPIKAITRNICKIYHIKRKADKALVADMVLKELNKFKVYELISPGRFTKEDPPKPWSIQGMVNSYLYGSPRQILRPNSIIVDMQDWSN